MGAWVDTYDIRSIDRYPEQLWAGLLAKAPEQTLFEWGAMASDKPATAGNRPWTKQATSFRWPAGRGGWASAANEALQTIDGVLGRLGNPVGVASYRPAHASGEDFLHNYIGNLGVPIELYPEYPTRAHTILLTEAAATDPQIISKIQASLHGGANVIVTSGFLGAMQGKGFEQLAEWHMTGHTISIDRYFDGFGAGAGKELKDPAKSKPVLFPEVRFYTNDSWGIIRGVAAKKGFPIAVMDHYSNGTLYLWNMPENFGDLYNLPQPMITRIKQYLFADQPVQIDAPDHVALFTYDNGAFVVENFRDDAARVNVSGKMTQSVTIPPHSFRLFKP
jgi:hypothetical protein